MKSRNHAYWLPLKTCMDSLKKKLRWKVNTDRMWIKVRMWCPILDQSADHFDFIFCQLYFLVIILIIDLPPKWSVMQINQRWFLKRRWHKYTSKVIPPQQLITKRKGDYCRMISLHESHKNKVKRPIFGTNKKYYSHDYFGNLWLIIEDTMCPIKEKWKLGNRTQKNMLVLNSASWISKKVIVRFNSKQ